MSVRADLCATLHIYTASTSSSHRRLLCIRTLTTNGQMIHTAKFDLNTNGQIIHTAKLDLNTNGQIIHTAKFDLKQR